MNQQRTFGLIQPYHSNSVGFFVRLQSQHEGNAILDEADGHFGCRREKVDDKLALLKPFRGSPKKAFLHR